MYDDGRVRVQRRCAENSRQYYFPYARPRYVRGDLRGRPVHRIDRWYACLEDVYPLLSAMTQSNRYILDPVKYQLPGATMSPEKRALHAYRLAERRSIEAYKASVSVSDETPVF